MFETRRHAVFLHPKSGGVCFLEVRDREIFLRVMFFKRVEKNVEIQLDFWLIFHRFLCISYPYHLYGLACAFLMQFLGSFLAHFRADFEAQIQKYTKNGKKCVLEVF